MTCQKRRKIKIKNEHEHIGGRKKEEKKNDDSRKTVDFISSSNWDPTKVNASFIGNKHH